MNIALALVCLCHEQVCNMPTNVVLIADSIATEDLLQSSIIVSIGFGQKEPDRHTSWR